jgi:NAD(P)-dependent dehydrogenase (short-subunit alcohol dehydrogenase family)
MSNSPKPLTGNRTIKEWLDSPVGGPILRALLSQGGQDESALKPVLSLPLKNLVAMSGGALTQDILDGLVRQANSGQIPVEEELPVASGARFTGKTVIVTGAGAGIGRATAERIASEGGRVIAVDIAEDRLADLARVHPEAAITTLAGDITNQDDIVRIIAAAGPRIDGLANIAGIMDGMVPLHETTDELWERVIRVNLDGSFKLSRAVLPKMLDAGQGSIVNIASEAAFRGNAAGTAYTVSKHAIVGLTKSSAFLYGPQGIRTNAVAPGPVATSIEGAMKSDFGKERIGPFMVLMPPVTVAEKLAAAIAWLLSDDSDNVNGAILPSDGGWAVQ